MKCIRDTYIKNMSPDIKRSKAQLSKMIQSGGFPCNVLGNLRKKAIKNIAIPLARNNLPGLVRKLVSNTKNKFERKVSGKGTGKIGKGFTFFISNKDMSNINIIESLEDSNVLIGGITETVEHEKKKQEGRFIPVLLAHLLLYLCNQRFL